MFSRDAPVALDVLAVTPMRRHAPLGDLMHLLGADLHFHALLLRTDDRRVDRAITVGFRVGDKILEALGDHPPCGVKDTQRTITVVFAFNDDAKAEYVRQGFEVELLVLQLAPDGVRPFATSIDPRV